MPNKPHTLHPLRVLFAGSLVALAGLVGSASPAVAAPGCSKVASPSGSDSAPGSAAAPLRTAQKLADSLAPGQTGCLRRGTYTDGGRDSVLSPSRGHIAIRSFPGERARLVGIIEIKRGVDAVTLSALDIEGNAKNGANTIKIYARNAVIEDSDITNRWRGRSCLMLGNISGGGQAVRPVIRRNRFHECGSLRNGNHDHAIYASNTSGGEITDNVFYNSAAYTVQFYPSAQNMLFARNVVDGGNPSIRGGIVFGGDSRHASNHNTVESNVIANAATHNITSNWEGPRGTGNTARGNCVWGGRRGNVDTPNGFTARNNMTTNPGFTGRAQIAANSPCARLLRGQAVQRLRAPRPRPKRLRVKLRARANPSSRRFNRRGRLWVSVRVRNGGLRNARLLLVGRAGTLASRSVQSLQGRRRVKLYKRHRVGAGSYVVLLIATDRGGKVVTRTRLVRFSG